MPGEGGFSCFFFLKEDILRRWVISFKERNKELMLVVSKSYRIIVTLFGSFLLYNCPMLSSYKHNGVSCVTRSSTDIILT